MDISQKAIVYVLLYVFQFSVNAQFSKIKTEFQNSGELSIDDYIPTNTVLVKNREMIIDKIPYDSLGLTIGCD